MHALARVPRHDPPPTNLRDVMALLGVSAGKLAAIVGTSPRNVDRWKAVGIPAAATTARNNLWTWLWAQGVDPRSLTTGGSDMSDDTSVTDLAAERAKRVSTPPRSVKPATNPPTQPPSKQENPPMETIPREELGADTLLHFGLDPAASPWDEPESPEEMYMYARLEQAEATCLKAIRQRRIIALCGPSGAGKSTLQRRIQGRIGREQRVRPIMPASLDRRRITHAALSIAILRDLIGKDTGGYSMEARSELLRRTLGEQDSAGLFPVLLIDECHLLGTDALLAIKQLWDSHTAFRQLGVLLFGQLGLRDTLKRDPAVRELTGRTTIHELSKLSPAETAGYVGWRFTRVHADATRVFADDAYTALSARGELPLWINNLAIRGMLYAHRIGDTRVTATHIGRV